MLFSHFQFQQAQCSKWPSVRSLPARKTVARTSQPADFPLSLLERLRTPPQVRAGEVFGRGANVFGKWSFYPNKPLFFALASAHFPWIGHLPAAPRSTLLRNSTGGHTNTEVRSTTGETQRRSLPANDWKATSPRLRQARETRGGAAFQHAQSGILWPARGRWRVSSETRLIAPLRTCVSPHSWPPEITFWYILGETATRLPHLKLKPESSLVCFWPFSRPVERSTAS